MRSLLILAMAFFSVSLSAQTDTLFDKKFKFGLRTSVGLGIWQQNNLNRALESNNVPSVSNAQFVSNLGLIGQWDKFRLSALIGSGASFRSRHGEEVSQQFGHVEIEGDYAVLRKKAIRIAPAAGIGFIGGYTKVTKDFAPQQSLGQLLSNRQTAELYNHQGFVNLGINVGFLYCPHFKDHLLQFSTGYRMGFANSPWGSRPATNDITGDITDEIRQWYATLGLTLIGKEKHKRFYRKK